MSDIGTISIFPEGFRLADRYEIQRVIGQGGMGIVYLAKDTRLHDELFAIKTIKPELLIEPKGARNLSREARAAQRLSHPNIVRVFHYDEWKGVSYLVMEYIDGRTLADILVDQDKLSEDEFFPVASDLCDGLGYAHEQGIIHQDIKPSNIFVDSKDRAKLVDFGIARIAVDATTRLTGRMPRGALAYMSPELLDGEEPTPASDIYSLGIAFYEMLSGDPPFVRGDIYRQHHEKKPKPVVGIAKKLNDAILAGLEKKPESRPESIGAYWGSLSQHSGQISSQSKTEKEIYQEEVQPKWVEEETKHQVTREKETVIKEEPEKRIEEQKQIIDVDDQVHDQETIPSEKVKVPGKFAIGLMIVLVANILLFQNFGSQHITFGKLWPVFIIIFGTSYLSKKPDLALVTFLIGAVFLLNNFRVFPQFFSIGKLWPVFIIIIGISMLLKKRRNE